MIRKDYLAFGKPSFSEDEISAVSRVMRSGWVGMGPETLAFEDELAAFFGVPHVVTVNSCTSALFLSLLVSGVGAGDEVICPSLTWCATANVALQLGAKPVFCDVDRQTLCVTEESIRKRLTPRTKAVIVVHLGGLAVEVQAIRSALPPGVVLIEDAAHALGARFLNDRPVGSSGNLTCFSFYANKNLSTGDGGAIALHDGDLAARLRSLRQNAMPADAWKRFSHPRSLPVTELSELGYKMNYTDLQASIGRVQLARQPELRERRRAVAMCYCERLESIVPGVRFQFGVQDPRHALHLFLLYWDDGALSQSRDSVLLALRERQVGAAIHYAPLHRMPLYGVRSPLPETEWLGSRILTLPISGGMSLEDANYVVRQFKEVIS